MALRTIESLGELSGKVVLLRCDLNVPLKDGVIGDDGRIRASLPTINALLHSGATVVAMSHLGRPDGEPNPDREPNRTNPRRRTESEPGRAGPGRDADVPEPRGMVPRRASRGVRSSTRVDETHAIGAFR